MHFLTLVTVDIPELPEDEITNKEISAKIEELEKGKTESSSNFMFDFFFQRLNGQLTTFSREVENETDYTLEPYSECDERYQEFYDVTEELQSRYETEFGDCIKLANGRIVSVWDSEAYEKYIIKNGKVYQKHWGPLGHEKSTKKSKKMRALPQYPVSKRYASFNDFAESRSIYDEEYQAYGYYWNPNSFYDWYEIGGRWPDIFLVRQGCKEYLMRCSMDEARKEAPEGYMWVCAARKKDIEWETQFNWLKKKAIEKYGELVESFKTGELLEEPYARITEEGIVRFDNKIYIKNETLEEYLYRHCLDESCKYNQIAFAYLKDGRWNSKYDLKESSDKVTAEHEWGKHLAAFIDEIGEDTVIVGVDNHQ